MPHIHGMLNFSKYKHIGFFPEIADATYLGFWCQKGPSLTKIDTLDLSGGVKFFTRIPRIQLLIEQGERIKGIEGS
jgi:hypothetical protein